MKTQRFGIEIEFDGLSVEGATDVVTDYFGGEFDQLGRKWSVVPDASVPTGFELVSPPIYYADLFTLQELFRRLRQAKARRSSAAGIHIHMAAADLSLQQLMSLVNLYANHAELIVKMLNVYTHRRLLFSQPIYPFAKRLIANPPTTIEELRKLWYEVSDIPDTGTRYNESRYTEVNMNSYFLRQTIEFRSFNSTNHAGKIRSIVMLVLAMFHYAKHFSGLVALSPVLPSTREETLDAVSRFLYMLSLREREYRNMRQHLRQNVDRHYKRDIEGTKHSVVFASSAGLSFDGGSFSEVVDEMWDNGYFDQDDVFSALLLLRKRGKAIGDNPWVQQLTNSKQDQEVFCEIVLRYIEDQGLGKFTVIE